MFLQPVRVIIPDLVFRTLERVVKLIFVRREWPYLFSVKHEISILFFVNRDLNRSCEA